MGKFSNIEAEKAIIHILLHHPQRMGEIDEAFITSEDFSRNVFSELYQVIKQLYLDTAKIEPASVIAKGKELGFRFVSSPKNVKSLQVLLKKKPAADNLVMYCKIVKNASIKALLTYKMDEAKGLIEESSTGIEALGQIENLIYDFGNALESTGDEIIQLGKHADRILKELAESPAIGLSTGLPTYDKLIGGGLRDGSVHVIGARPKQGKSQIALKICFHNAVNGIPSLYLDTELQDRDQVPRMVAILMGIPFEELETGRWLRIKEYVDAYKKGKKLLEEIPFYWVRVAGRPLDEIKSLIRRFVMKIAGTNEKGRYNKCLVCYDYMKLMTSRDLSNSIKEYQAIGFAIQELHDLMGDYNAAMLMMLQLNREDEASQSDRITWFCDSFTKFQPLIPEELSLTKGECTDKLWIERTRHGQGTPEGVFIGIQADKGKAYFKDMGRKRLLKHDDEDEDI